MKFTVELEADQIIIQELTALYDDLREEGYEEDYIVQLITSIPTVLFYYMSPTEHRDWLARRGLQ